MKYFGAQEKVTLGTDRYFLDAGGGGIPKSISCTAKTAEKRWWEPRGKHQASSFYYISRLIFYDKKFLHTLFPTKKINHAQPKGEKKLTPQKTDPSLRWTNRPSCKRNDISFQSLHTTKSSTNCSWRLVNHVTRLTFHRCSCLPQL